MDGANNGSHRALLDRQIAKWQAGHPEAKAARLEFIDRDRHVAVLVDRQSSSVDMRDALCDNEREYRYFVNLPR